MKPRRTLERRGRRGQGDTGFGTVSSLATSAVLLLLAIIPFRADSAAGQYQVVVELRQRVKMRDGITLIADIYRPSVAGKFPVLLERTPYNRTGNSALARALASHGYVVVLQDTRGRYDSEGEFYPFRYESQDGYDTVEWAAQAEYSNGLVGMLGGSYVGATQMLAAMAKPSHLAAIHPYVTASEYYDGWTYQNGALMQWFTGSWTALLSVDTFRKQVDQRLRPAEWLKQLPVGDYRLLNLPPPNSLAPYYRDWIDHERDDDYWKRWKVSDHYREMAVKALHSGGWHDIFLKGSIKNYVGMREGSATRIARDGQRLTIGPWAHAPTSPEGKIGDVIFGPGALRDETEETLEWCDYSLKGAQNRYATQPPVRIFVMGDNIWREEAEFPITRTRYTKYFIHSRSGANTLSGDGGLTAVSPDSERPDVYEYDPRDPVPTIGGRLCCGASLPPGPADQRPNESRRDLLVFSTPVLESDLEVTGFITFDLYAASSAVDTDFTAMLADVDPGGYARLLTDGIVRAQYRNSSEKPEAVVPGSIYKYSIDLWATSNVFKAGHRIRLYLSSSNFPRFNRNLNTGEPISGSTRMIKARQTIYHDAQHPSAITLPVIPR